MLVELLLLVLLLAVLLLYMSTVKPDTMPPGSFGYPIIGKLPPLNMHITAHLQQLKNQFGKIYTTKWGSHVVVVLADYSLIKKALNHPDFQGRMQLFSFDIFTFFKNYGIVSSTGKVWQANRQFIIHHLRDLGMDKTVLENSIQDEAKMLVEYLEEHNLAKHAEMDWSINVAVVNVIWQMMASKRYPADDEKIIHFNKCVDETFDVSQGPIFLLNMMPWLVNVIPKYVRNEVMKANVLERNRNELYAYFNTIIEEHKATLDPDNPRDIIDYYLMEIEACKDDPETTFVDDPAPLHSIMFDIFTGGSETTSTTLRWMILYMAVKPQVQRKVQQNLDEVVPRDRLPSLQDREHLPYVDAMLLDVLRLSSLFPTALPHQATADVQFEGYTIPKGTMILPCLEMCHRDPDVWKCPDDLYPEHFLSKDGKLDSKKDSFAPFSLGRRRCLGESLARMELFLFSSAILQRFTIEPPPGVVLDTSTDPEKKMINTPKSYKVLLKKRI